jgi:putative NADH-flavin reductase
MKILVIGANGRTGRQVIEHGLARGHQLTAIVRSARSLEQRKNLHCLVGDPLNEAFVSSSIKDNDVIISTLARGTDKVQVLSQGASSVVAAIGAGSRVRYIIVSQALLFPSRSLAVYILKLILKSAVTDSKVAETVVTNSVVLWTIVRPPRLTNSIVSTGFVSSANARPNGKSSIARSVLAKFLISEAESASYVKKIVGVSAT